MLDSMNVVKLKRFKFCYINFVIQFNYDFDDEAERLCNNNSHIRLFEMKVVYLGAPLHSPFVL